MNAKILLKLLAVGASIVLAGILLRGHGVITAFVLSAASLLIVSKIIGAFIFRSNWRGRGLGGSSPPQAPFPVTAPRPPGAPPELSCHPCE